jgi:hypothetical protein
MTSAGQGVGEGGLSLLAGQVAAQGLERSSAVGAAWQLQPGIPADTPARALAACLGVALDALALQVAAATGSEDVPDDRSELLLLVKAGGLPVTVIAVVYCWQVVPRRSRVGGGDAVAPIPLGLVEGGVGAGEDGVRRSVRGLQGRHPDADGN